MGTHAAHPVSLTAVNLGSSGIFQPQLADQELGKASETSPLEVWSEACLNLVATVGKCW
jgi:hypothetical protein